MTGPEHYQEAEEGIRASTYSYQRWGEEGDPETAEAVLDAALWEMRRAQVHATLALAAATALGRFGEFPAYDAEAWLNTASTQPVAVEDLDGEVAAPEAPADRTDELRLLAGAILASFTQGQDGYRARVGQVQIQRWHAALDGGQ